MACNDGIMVMCIARASFRASFAMLCVPLADFQDWKIFQDWKKFQSGLESRSAN
jgi:hypothetical protein